MAPTDKLGCPFCGTEMLASVKALVSVRIKLGCTNPECRRNYSILVNKKGLVSIGSGDKGSMQANTLMDLSTAPFKKAASVKWTDEQLLKFVELNHLADQQEIAVRQERTKLFAEFTGRIIKDRARERMALESVQTMGPQAAKAKDSKQLRGQMLADSIKDMEGPTAKQKLDWMYRINKGEVTEVNAEVNKFIADNEEEAS